MAQAGVLTEAHPITKPDLDRLLTGLEDDKEYIWKLYAVIAFSTGLRTKDVLSFRWVEILGKAEVYKKESKTKKVRLLTFSQKTQDTIKEIYEEVGKPDENQLIFKSPQTNKAYTSRHINRIFQQAAVQYQLSISPHDFKTHSFRKGWGTFNYENATDKSAMLNELCYAYGHSSPAITLCYIGITRKSIQNLYLSIEL